MNKSYASTRMPKIYSQAHVCLRYISQNYVCTRFQVDIIEAFNSTSRYLDDLLNIDNIYFDQMVDRIYPTELQLNRANSSDTEAPFFGFESMGYTYLNLLDSPELLQILMTLTTVIKPLLPKFLDRAIVILNFLRRFRNFIADTVPC